MVSNNALKAWFDLLQQNICLQTYSLKKIKFYYMGL
jgi:hypothetical protein